MYQGEASKIPQYLKNLLLPQPALSPENFYTLEWFRGGKWQHHTSLTKSFLPPHPAVQGITYKKNYVQDSFPFLSACEEVVDSSTFFESNQEYIFFLDSLLRGMNAKELVLS